MTELKTQANTGSVIDFINAIDDETKRQDSSALLAILKRATGEEPVMWGDSIIGFGKYSYKAETAGGKVLMPKTLITEDIGYMGILLDSEGNRIAVHTHK